MSQHLTTPYIQHQFYTKNKKRYPDQKQDFEICLQTESGTESDYWISSESRVGNFRLRPALFKT